MMISSHSRQEEQRHLIFVVFLGGAKSSETCVMDGANHISFGRCSNTHTECEEFRVSVHFCFGLGGRIIIKGLLAAVVAIRETQNSQPRLVNNNNELGKSRHENHSISNQKHEKANNITIYLLLHRRRRTHVFQNNVEMDLQRRRSVVVLQQREQLWEGGLQTITVLLILEQPFGADPEDRRSQNQCRSFHFGNGIDIVLDDGLDAFFGETVRNGQKHV
jgi:hypothetical protein